jgi:hypothetical protein
MQKLIRLLLAAAVIGIVFLIWWVLFPSPERVIRKRLKNLAEIVSFESDEGSISKAFKAQKLTDYFPLEVEINVDLPGFPEQSIAGRDELMRGLLAAQSRLSGLNVHFPDMNVKLSEDKLSAVANVTARVNFSGDSNFNNVVELDITFQKVEGRWLIIRIATVKTLSLNVKSALAFASHEP